MEHLPGPGPRVEPFVCIIFLNPFPSPVEPRYFHTEEPKAWRGSTCPRATTEKLPSQDLVPAPMTGEAMLFPMGSRLAEQMWWTVSQFP